MATVEIRVDIKNRFLAFEQEGDDDVAGELLDKFNQKKEEKALKKAIKAAAKEKSQPKKPDTIDVSPKTQKTGSTAEGDTGLQIERKKKKKKKRVEIVSEVVVEEGPRERVVYQGGKEFTRKTNSTFAAKMLAITIEAEQSARNNRSSRSRGGFRRDRKGLAEPSYDANVTATEEVLSGHFKEVPNNNNRPYSGRGGFRQGRVGFDDQVQHVSSSEKAVADFAEEASLRHVGEHPRNRSYRGRGVFSQSRVGFSGQQVPSPENATAVVEEASSSQFEDKPMSSRPYRGRGGYRRYRETEPEVKQYTLDEWKKMQAEIHKNSSLNVAKTKEGAKENEIEEKFKVKNVAKKENSNTCNQIKLGTASYYGRRGRGRNGMDRIDFGDEKRSSRVSAEAPNVSDDSSFPRLK